MRPNPLYDESDPQVVRRLIADNPFSTLVSLADGHLVASHYPVLVEEGPGLSVVTHVGRPDEQVHRFGAGEMLLIVTGQHGYISPSWYSDAGTPVPTWNFSVAHCYGVAQVLDPTENLQVLGRLVHHFERHVRAPLELSAEAAARIGPGTVGIRLRIDRFVCKVKLSQDKDLQSRRNVVAALRAPGPYRQPVLADEMERLLPQSGESCADGSVPDTAPQ